MGFPMFFLFHILPFSRKQLAEHGIRWLAAFQRTRPQAREQCRRSAPRDINRDATRSGHQDSECGIGEMLVAGSAVPRRREAPSSLRRTS